jgi:hypothetical protein
MSAIPPIGTWFYDYTATDDCELWQQQEHGPERIGVINNQISAEYICERLNEPPEHLK